jgi:tetratricopeptide (TPR) repeat protein
MKSIPVILAALAMTACGTVPEPRLDSAAPSASEAQLLERATGLFSEADYAGARALAEQALALNPASADALFALAASHYAMGEYANSIAVSRRAARLRSALLPDIYLLMGSGYERLDQPWDALRTYRYAAARYPQNALAQYRLALMYIAVDKPERAADTLKCVLHLEPLDTDAHFELGMLYAEHGYRTPALLALSMALAIEPQQDHAAMIHQTIDALLAKSTGPTARSGPGRGNPAAKDEGDFSAIEGELAKVHGAALARGVDPHDPAIPRAQYRALFDVLAQADDREQAAGFVGGFYLPLYRTIAEQGLEETFVNHIFMARGEPDSRRWIVQHPAQAQRLQATIRSHWSNR